MSKDSKFQSRVLYELHSSPIASHSGFHKTYERIKRSFFLEGMKKDIRTFVAECDNFQRNKGEDSETFGLTTTFSHSASCLDWTDISMDFIVGLPKYGNKSVIMVMVDRLSKYPNFFALHHPFKASTVYQVFMDNILKLHGMSKYIVTVTPLSLAFSGKRCLAPRNSTASQRCI